MYSDSQGKSESEEYDIEPVQDVRAFQLSADSTGVSLKHWPR